VWISIFDFAMSVGNWTRDWRVSY